MTAKESSHEDERIEGEKRVSDVFEVAGSIKWFDPSKGLGVIVPDEDLPDVLLNVTCLRRDGYETAYEGARVICHVLRQQGGLQAFRILSLESSSLSKAEDSEYWSDKLITLQLMAEEMLILSRRIKATAEISKLGDKSADLPREAHEPVDDALERGLPKKSSVSAGSAERRLPSSNRFLSSRKDVEEFEAAAREYVKKHTKNKKAAFTALRRMGIVTARGRLTKHYS